MSQKLTSEQYEQLEKIAKANIEKSVLAILDAHDHTNSYGNIKAYECNKVVLRNLVDAGMIEPFERDNQTLFVTPQGLAESMADFDLMVTIDHARETYLRYEAREKFRTMASRELSTVANDAFAKALVDWSGIDVEFGITFHDPSWWSIEIELFYDVDIEDRTWNRLATLTISEQRGTIGARLSNHGFGTDRTVEDIETYGRGIMNLGKIAQDTTLIPAIERVLDEYNDQGMDIYVRYYVEHNR